MKNSKLSVIKVLTVVGIILSCFFAISCNKANQLQIGKRIIYHNYTTTCEIATLPKTCTSDYTYIGEPLPRVGHNFLGWYDNRDFLGEPLQVIESQLYDKDIHLYGKWQAIEYQVDYELYDGSFDNNMPTTHLYGVDTRLIEPKKTGYDFLGYYTNPAFEGSAFSVLGGREFDKTIVLYAKWGAKKYNINYNGVVQNQNLPSTHTYGVDTVLLDANCSGYTFVGWYDNANFEGTPIAKLKADGFVEDINLYAKWQPKLYSINYQTNGGAIDKKSPTMHLYGTDTKLYAPTKVGYAFAGWYDNALFEGQPISVLQSTQYLQDINLYAKWDTIKYKINYQLNGGVLGQNSPIVHQFGKDTILVDAMREGFEFLGWYVEFEDEPTTILGGNQYFADINLHARWENLE